ncbi:hypothetical protein [Mycolicibacterium sp.]|uniref:hypothetical protein n=1 Tax=Mycolicibacterium sp. TaxID=2320850 RepID=UPI0037CA023C
MSNGFASIEDIKAANRALGHSWFDNGTTAYHGSRIESEVIDGFYFVESSFSVAGDDSSGRIYRAVAASPNGELLYLGGSQDQYATADEALTRIHAVTGNRS